MATGDRLRLGMNHIRKVCPRSVFLLHSSQILINDQAALPQQNIKSDCNFLSGRLGKGEAIAAAQAGCIFGNKSALSDCAGTRAH
jgi:hypothetical protein